MEQNQKHSSVTSPEFGKFLEEYEIMSLHTKFIDRTVTIVLASLGLIAALAWENALKAVFTALVGNETVGEKIAYALVVTLVAILATSILSRVAKKKEDALHTH